MQSTMIQLRDPFLDTRPAQQSTSSPLTPRLLRKKNYKDADTKVLTATNYSLLMTPVSNSTTNDNHNNNNNPPPPSPIVSSAPVEPKEKEKEKEKESSPFLFWRRKSKRMSSRKERDELLEKVAKEDFIAVDPAFMESFAQSGKAPIAVDPEYLAPDELPPSMMHNGAKNIGSSFFKNTPIAVDGLYISPPTSPPPPTPPPKDRKGSISSSNKLQKPRKGSNSSTGSTKIKEDLRKGSEASWFTSPKYSKGRLDSESSVYTIKPSEAQQKRRRPSSDESFLDARPKPRTRSKARKRQGIIFGDGTVAPLTPMHGDEYVDTGHDADQIDRRAWGSIGDIRIIETFSIVEEVTLKPPPLGLRTRRSSAVLPFVKGIDVEKTPRTMTRMGSRWNIDAGEGQNKVHVEDDGYLDYYLADTDPAGDRDVHGGGEEDVEYILLDQAKTFVDEMTEYIK